MSAFTHMSDPDAIISKFGEVFDHPRDLWKAMAKYCAILSGSRSLDMFIPGSCDNQSDWDFYVAPNAHCVVGMIKALEACGIVFQLPFDHLVDFIGPGPDCHIDIEQARLLATAYEAASAAEKQAAPRVAVRIIEAIQGFPNNGYDPVGFTIPISAEKRLIVRGSDRTNYDHVPGLHVIRGSHSVNKHKVQLMYAPSTTPSQHVLRFHSSAVQSLISPYAAIHFYGELAAAKVSWKWRGNSGRELLMGQPPSGEDHEDANDRYSLAFQKYRSRGYTVIDRPSSYHQPAACNLQQNGRAFFAFDDQHDVEVRIADSRRRLLNCLSWIELTDRTTPLPTPESVGRRARIQSSARDAIFADAVAICKKFAIQADRLFWRHPDDIDQL